MASDRPDLLGALKESLSGCTIGLTSVDGHCVRVECGAREQADRLFELLEDVGTLVATSCPKCGLDFKELLHPFCTHERCPARNAAQLTSKVRA